MKMPFLLISPKIVPKIQLIKKGGCFEYHAVIADKIEYRYIHRASICPASGMDRRSFFMPKTMGKYKRLEVFHLSKPVYTADKPSDCHYCYFWTNGRKGCRLGRNNCYYSHIIDDDRRLNAERMEAAFYSGRQATPEPVQPAATESSADDKELLLKLLQNPEMAALLKSLAKTL